mgnify:CR=1 FL=1|jgi:hypothetical protein
MQPFGPEMEGKPFISHIPEAVGMIQPFSQ